MKYTEEQRALMEHVGTKNHFCGRARAGTGKTSTGVAICGMKKSRKIRYVAFTVANATDLKAKMPINVDSSTWNSFGAKCFIKRPELDKFKMSNIITENENYNPRGVKGAEAVTITDNKNGMVKLCNLMKNYSLHPKREDVIYLLENYDIGISLNREQVILDCLSFVARSDGMTSKIDFTDQIRFPCLNNSWKADVDMFIVDEQQDNTRIRNIAMEQLANKGVQIGAFGDDLQSIYGFTGADCRSMERFKEFIGEDNIFPLTINFRCAKSIIREAQKLVPDIRYWEESPEGVVNRIETKDFYNHFKDGEVAIGRFNKIITPIAFKLIKEGKKAQIQGRDFGEQLKDMIKGFKATSIEEFYSRLKTWMDRQSKYMDEDCPAFQFVMDKHDCLKFFADSCETVEQIYNRIDGIFSDAKTDGFLLMTGHKSKGLEFDNTYILDSTKFKMCRPNMTANDHQQEKNVFYVATTRARKQLTFVQ